MLLFLSEDVCTGLLLPHRWPQTHSQWWECVFTTEGIIDNGESSPILPWAQFEGLCCSGALLCTRAPWVEVQVVKSCRLTVSHTTTSVSCAGGGFRDCLTDISEELCPSSGDVPVPLPFFVRTSNQVWHPQPSSILTADSGQGLN